MFKSSNHLINHFSKFTKNQDIEIEIEIEIIDKI